MIAAADGTTPQRVGAGAGAGLSPDSTRLLYTSTDPADGGQAPVVSDLAGGGRIRVAPAAVLRANALRQPACLPSIAPRIAPNPSQLPTAIGMTIRHGRTIGSE